MNSSNPTILRVRVRERGKNLDKLALWDRRPAAFIERPLNSDSRTSADLVQVREYLQVLARMQIQGHMQAKVDMSGVIQITLVEAHQNRDHWQSLPEYRRLAWFREVFSNNLHDEIRRFRTRSRDVTKERSIHRSIEDSASRFHDWLEADISSPSSRAVRAEEALRLARALSELPDDQRMALELHHLAGLPLAEVAVELNRTREAVAMLVYRGIKSLRRKLPSEKESLE